MLCGFELIEVDQVMTFIFFILFSLSSKKDTAQSVDVIVDKKQTSEEAKTREVNKLHSHRQSC